MMAIEIERWLQSDYLGNKDNAIIHLLYFNFDALVKAIESQLSYNWADKLDTLQDLNLVTSSIIFSVMVFLSLFISVLFGKVHDYTNFVYLKLIKFTEKDVIVLKTLISSDFSKYIIEGSEHDRNKDTKELLNKVVKNENSGLPTNKQKNKNLRVLKKPVRLKLGYFVRVIIFIFLISLTLLCLLGGYLAIHKSNTILTPMLSVAKTLTMTCISVVDVITKTIGRFVLINLSI